MNYKILKLNLLLLIVFPFNLYSQDIDTLVDLGTHKMHFRIWKGEGTPILFESGGGNDGTIWNHLLAPLHSITGTTLITYDRTGYGKSELNPTLADDKKSLITHGIEDLEKSLKLLGYNNEIMLVGHSYGGFYNQYFTVKNPELVKAIVLIDATLSCFHTTEYMQKRKEERTEEWLDYIKSQSIGLYYECLANQETIDIMEKVEVPKNISIINFVAGRDNPDIDSITAQRWRICHKNFVAASPNRIGITANECGHYIFYDNPSLVIHAIAQAFTNVNGEKNTKQTLQNLLTYNINHSNQNRADEYAYWHSERETNRWGYQKLNEEQLEVALKILELNTLLYPNSFNTWDSYGEILLKMGQKKKAIKMYQKSLELNPDNENGKKILAELLKEE